MNSKWLKYLALIGVNALYASESIFTKSASACRFGSLSYCLWFAGAVAIMGLYAICWQQILKRIELSTAYMFKGTSLIFVMFLAFAFFGEPITIMNVIGAAVIITGITLYARE